eukprot:GHVP01020370.1.p1 GENE.GHVP01020370.1~~GHVP01020370.1.p1  ORF type:complete len:481 (+),score=90.88 GHVP01020370.1:798-2240(+)
MEFGDEGVRSNDYVVLENLNSQFSDAIKNFENVVLEIAILDSKLVCNLDQKDDDNEKSPILKNIRNNSFTTSPQSSSPSRKNMWSYAFPPSMIGGSTLKVMRLKGNNEISSPHRRGSSPSTSFKFAEPLMSKSEFYVNTIQEEKIKILENAIHKFKELAFETSEFLSQQMQTINHRIEMETLSKEIFSDGVLGKERCFFDTVEYSFPTDSTTAVIIEEESTIESDVKHIEFQDEDAKTEIDFESKRISLDRMSDLSLPYSIQTFYFSKLKEIQELQQNINSKDYLCFLFVIPKYRRDRKSNVFWDLSQLVIEADEESSNFDTPIVFDLNFLMMDPVCGDKIFYKVLSEPYNRKSFGFYMRNKENTDIDRPSVPRLNGLFLYEMKSMSNSFVTLKDGELSYTNKVFLVGIEVTVCGLNDWKDLTIRIHSDDNGAKNDRPMKLLSFGWYSALLGHKSLNFEIFESFGQKRFGRCFMTTHKIN